MQTTLLEQEPMIPAQGTPPQASSAATRSITLAFLIGCVTLIMTGFAIILPVFPQRLHALGQGAETLALMEGAFGLGMFLFSTPMGTLAGKIGRKPILLLSLVGYILTNLLFMWVPMTRAFAASTGPMPHLQQATVTLDGVTVNVATRFLSGPFGTSLPRDATQTAVAGIPEVNVHPYGAIFITAVPYETYPKTEDMPVAQAGSTQTYQNSLYQYRVQEGDTPQVGPIAIWRLALTRIGLPVRTICSWCGKRRPGMLHTECGMRA